MTQGVDDFCRAMVPRFASVWGSAAQRRKSAKLAIRRWLRKGVMIARSIPRRPSVPTSI